MNATVWHRRDGARVLVRHRGSTVPAIHRRVNNTEYVVYVGGCAESHDLTDAAVRSLSPTWDRRVAMRSAAEATRGGAQQ